MMTTHYTSVTKARPSAKSTIHLVQQMYLFGHCSNGGVWRGQGQLLSKQFVAVLL